jgi:sarcosine oxidase subunit alpha
VTSHRLASGGRVDRSAVLRFSVDGVEYTGLRGDTLASALVANGVLAAARSPYRGRPRGIASAGVEEPNALVRLEGPCAEPMLPATTIELYDGLSAVAVSGLGRLDESADPNRYDKRFAHVDVLVVGAGPCGLREALAAARRGGRVLLVDDQPEPGGSQLSDPAGPDGDAADELAALPDVRVLRRSTALGIYDGNYALIAQRRTNHLGPLPVPGISRERLWHVRAREIVLATGAHERPIVFADNDRPGIMPAGAARTYANRYAALPGREVVVFTTNDSAYQAALDLQAAGADIAGLVDTRPRPPAELVQAAEAAGIALYCGAAVTGTEGSEPDGRVCAVHVAGLDDDAPATRITCDLVAVSGGWSPALQLFTQAGGTLRYDETVSAYVPDRAPEGLRVVGAAAGSVDAAAQPLWIVPGAGGDPSQWDTHFVDLQRDASVADVYRATGAGLRSAEHVKRYTTIGTAHDQGKTSNLTTLGVMAEALGAASPGGLGTTTSRPPYVPVSFALLAGRERGPLFDPERTTPIHSWHVARGAVFEDVGQWKRPHHYPRTGPDGAPETAHDAVLRECRAAREGVAMMDASTLGKIDVIGPDAGLFLDRLYTNGLAKTPVGTARYSVLCRADGMVFDDGVVLRLAEDHYYVTTTTGNAGPVLDWFEEWLQTEWPTLRVHCTSVTEQWATVAVVGPRSRAVVGALAPQLDVSAEAFPFMAVRETVLDDEHGPDKIPARVCRVSFSGELAYEVNVEGWYGLRLWESVLAAGAPYGITPYGTETMHVLRAEKGYPIVGQDTDGTVTPLDLGMSWIVSRRKDFVGKRSLRRPDTARPDRRHLVALLPDDPAELLPEGTQVVADAAAAPPSLGHVTSSYHSAALGRSFALALIASGRDRIGQTVHAACDDRLVPVRVAEPVLYDPEGARRDG